MTIKNTSKKKEIKPCWKCGRMLEINEYGYARCVTNTPRESHEAYVFGDLRDYKVITKNTDL